MSASSTRDAHARLKAIREEIRRSQQEPSNLAALRQTWRAYVSSVKRQVQDAHVEAGGETVYLGALSPGCQACKDGTWDCIFTTMRCNLDCAFCYSPHAVPQEYAGSAFGSTPEQIAVNHARTHITGVSFSGGEPFLDPEGLFDWIAALKDRSPDIYTWVYTNGLLVDEVHMRQLVDLGVDEMRFNTAATGYDHPAVLATIATASRIVPHVTVEIPAIPEDAQELLSSLALWSAAGVRFLNLHELIYEPGTNSASLSGARQIAITADGHRTAFNPQSRALTLAVMRKVQRIGLPLAINDCSMQSKLRQLRGRRRSLAPLTKAPHERLVDDRVYESYCAYQGEDVRFVHPDALDTMRRQYGGHQLVRLVRTAPLSLRDRGRWIVLEHLDAAD